MYTYKWNTVTSFLFQLYISNNLATNPPVLKYIISHVNTAIQTQPVNFLNNLLWHAYFSNYLKLFLEFYKFFLKWQQGRNRNQ